MLDKEFTGRERNRIGHESPLELPLNYFQIHFKTQHKCIFGLCLDFR